MLPMAQGFLSECFDRSRRAVLAKLRAGHETLRLAYEADLAEHRRRLDAAHARIAHAWRGKRVRLEFLARMSALMSVKKAWRRGVARRKLQAEIDARCAVSFKCTRSMWLSGFVWVLRFWSWGHFFSLVDENRASAVCARPSSEHFAHGGLLL